MLLALVRVGLLVIPFSTLRRLLPVRSRVPGKAKVARISWAVTAAARRLPGCTSCLVKALAADAMLRRRGYPSELRFGVRQRANHPTTLEAHAWIVSDDAVVVGALEDLSDYAVLRATGSA